jgi:hypothetical protein
MGRPQIDLPASIVANFTRRLRKTTLRYRDAKPNGSELRRAVRRCWRSKRPS